MIAQISNIIYPVILKVPEEKQALKGRESVQFLRGYAREAVIISAQKNGIELEALENKSDGAPVPSNGTYWSLSHKPQYVAGVAARHRVGIDIEPVRPVSPSLFGRVIDSEEQSLADKKSDFIFYRYWTAKESVLKVEGVGLKGLSRCKVSQMIGANNLEIRYQGHRWMIEHACYDNHVVSVISNNMVIQWIFPASGK